MSYLDRLRTCRYRTPSGAEFELRFTDLSRSGGHKAAVHEFPQASNPEVQDLGNTAQRFPLEAYFDGPDYDLRGDAFVRGLSETGPGTLLHPRWGDFSAMPLTWGQVETFVEGMGRSTFTVEFVRVDAQRFPTSAGALESELADTTAAIAVQAEETFAEEFAPVNAADAVAVEDDTLRNVATFYDRLKAIAAQGAEIATAFDRAVDELNTTYDTLIADPSLAAEAIIELFNTPAAAEAAIKDKVAAFSLALVDIAADLSSTSVARCAMGFLHLVALGLGLVNAVLTGTLLDREDAAQAAEGVQGATDTLTTAVESLEASGYAADAATMAALRAALSSASALLLEKSFSLRAARRVVLTRDYTPLDIVYEMIGPENADELEAVLDEFIAQNHLSGDDLLMLYRGREVAYYAR